MNRFWGSLAVCCLGMTALLGASCGTTASKPDGPPAQSVTLNPASMSKAPYEKGEIVILGTPVPVMVEAKQTSGGFTIISKVEGSPYEEEKYLADAASLRFAGTDVESFTPPIPLIAQPFEVPGEWTWAGTMKFAGKEFKASADLKSTKETLNLPGGPYDAFKIEADLSMQDPGGSIGKRKLSFWMTEQEGIIKREFAQSSTRQPVSSTNSES